MNVVLEGPDGSGKSTLAQLLCEQLGVRVQQGSGPPKKPGEVEERARFYLSMDRVIFDRHPCVSQPVYARIRGESMSDDLVHSIAELYTQNNLFIYCRAENLDRHVVKHDENPAHIKALTEKYNAVLSSYDAWALGHANVIYRIGDAVDPVVQLAHIHLARRR